MIKNYLRSLKVKLLRRLSRSVHMNSCRVGKHNQSNRDLWLEKTLAKIPSGSRILDVGAGELKYKRLCAHLNYVSQDFAQYDGKGDGKGFQTGAWDQSKLDIVSDITSIPDLDASFDAAMCIEVIEHVPHPIDALKELSRLLRPGGQLILTAPVCSLTHFAPYYYYNGYSRYFYEYWLERFNMEIVELTWNGNYFEYLAQEIRRLPEVSKSYTNTNVDAAGYMAIEQLLGMLDKLSAADQGSRDLLSFGLHVIAKKKW
jgi:ubiquinone/menaquinone biosynthesis C-methylase UbiE